MFSQEKAAQTQPAFDLSHENIQALMALGRKARSEAAFGLFKNLFGKADTAQPTPNGLPQC